MIAVDVILGAWSSGRRSGPSGVLVALIFSDFLSAPCWGIDWRKLNRNKTLPAMARANSVVPVLTL
jgi:hypothetical protein